MGSGTEGKPGTVRENVRRGRGKSLPRAIMREPLMLKTLIVIVVTAFTAGLLAETALAVYQLKTGAEVAVDMAVELGVCWLAVLSVFYAAVVRVANRLD